MVRIQLRYPDEATFIQRFAPNVTRGGIFLASRSPQASGTVIGFEVAVMQGPPLLSGTGKVTWVREFNPREPQRAHGMGVQFIQLSPDSRAMVDKLIGQKAMPPGSAPAAFADAATAESGRRSANGAPDALDGDPGTWMDDQAVKKAVDRARLLVSKTEDLEALRVREHEDAPTLAQALASLPRLLGPRR